MDRLKYLFATLLLLSFTVSITAQGRVHDAPLTIDLMIVGGTVVTMDKDHRVIEDGAVAINGVHILRVGTRGDVMRGLRARRTINAAGKVIIPGLINTHTHAAMSLFRGISD